MITKFERKVIAGLTAFLMCLSMIFAVPVSVNAEAERTQDEAVSGVQQNETVKDVQIPDGMSENVPHDIIAGDEAGDVPHDITVDHCFHRLIRHEQTHLCLFLFKYHDLFKIFFRLSYKRQIYFHIFLIIKTIF